MYVFREGEKVISTCADSTRINTYSHEVSITGHSNENRNLP